MNSFNITLVTLAAAVALAACGKKEEPAVVTPPVVSAPAPAASAPVAPVAASEPAKTEEKK